MHTQTAALGFIHIARTDALLGGADVTLAAAFLTQTVEQYVPGHDNMRT